MGTYFFLFFSELIFFLGTESPKEHVCSLTAREALLDSPWPSWLASTACFAKSQYRSNCDLHLSMRTMRSGASRRRAGWEARDGAGTTQDAGGAGRGRCAGRRRCSVPRHGRISRCSFFTNIWPPWCSLLKGLLPIPFPFVFGVPCFRQDHNCFLNKVSSVPLA
ncbi:hypothetical protein SETIT_7G323300v2 [Setaria italica]|uniref:Secreted protein n=1 Tax=Setaria italica TaxID=4555 RepID=A0A368S2C8_SETIT|nr:hypothetical protein SETIT_7G323300v2 [Setaria italica]